MHTFIHSRVHKARVAWNNSQNRRLLHLQILAKERPDAILPTMGGQTGLNIAKELSESGVLDKYGIELIGAKLPSIDRAEDRDLFKQARPAARAAHRLTHRRRHSNLFEQRTCDAPAVLF